jgi:hypothetical protein
MDPKRCAAVALLTAIAAGCVGQATPSAEPSGPVAVNSPIAQASRNPTAGPTLSQTIEPAPTIGPQPTSEDDPHDTPPPPDCPSHLPAQPMRLVDFVTLDPLCVGSATITVVGYAAATPAMGWEGPSVKPGWLVYPAVSVGLWQAKPSATYGCSGHVDCPWIFVHIPPRSSLTFDAKGRWVKVTGHIDDPAAATCHWVYPSDSSQDEKLPDSDAQRWCSESFVIEKVEVTTAP